VAVEHSVVGVGSIGVGVEVNEGNVAVTHDVGDTASVSEGDRVVTSQDDGDGTDCSDRPDHFSNPFQALVDISRDDVDVADVDHAEYGEWVDPGVEVRSGAVQIEVVGIPDRSRPEPRPGSV
jgi:hypothetical protein